MKKIKDMINREIVHQLTREIDIELLANIVSEEELVNLKYGAEGEIDYEAANGYILEIVIRRKSVK